MAGIEKTRDAIGVSLSDPNFSEPAVQLHGAPLRHAIATRLAGQGIRVVVIAVIDDNDEGAPWRQVELIWQLPDGGDFVRQTIRWELPSGALTTAADGTLAAASNGRQSAGIGGLRALRLTALGRS